MRRLSLVRAWCRVELLFAFVEDNSFQFNKRAQLFVGSHNEPLPVVGVRVNNPDRSPVGINRRDAAPTPTGVYDTTGPGLHTQNDKLI